MIPTGLLLGIEAQNEIADDTQPSSVDGAKKPSVITDEAINPLNDFMREWMDKGDFAVTHPEASPKLENGRQTLSSTPMPALSPNLSFADAGSARRQVAEPSGVNPFLLPTIPSSPAAASSAWFNLLAVAPPSPWRIETGPSAQSATPSQTESLLTPSPADTTNTKTGEAWRPPPHGRTRNTSLVSSSFRAWFTVR
ncbi:MAG: hypothetical protein J6386_07560 [Candidatus Synoicihabitans palmerolidicus]|nr:hypothetical protein [Candidatus Synoicihabitans palmerolidicus]